MSAAGKPQCMVALEAANKVRTAKAKLKRRIRTGEQCPVALLRESCRREFEKVLVVEFLTFVPSVGTAKVKRLTMGLVFSQTLMLKDLSPSTREQLAGRLAEHLSSAQKGREARLRQEQARVGVTPRTQVAVAA